MLIKKYDEASGKFLKKEKPLLINPSKGYIRPKESGPLWWLSTTSIWNVDELIGRRIRDWRRLTQETGHDGSRAQSMRTNHDTLYTGTMSVFPVPLAEWIILRFGGPEGGLIIDAFSGGPPRAIASGLMRYNYVGYDIRQEQIDENVKIVKGLEIQDQVKFICSDGCLMKETEDGSGDFGLTCPPYFDLEIYSDLPNDLSSQKTYNDFLDFMFTCLKSYRRVLKPDAFLCIVTAPFRLHNDKGVNEQVDFPGDTIALGREAGFYMWQNIVLSRNFASAASRSTVSWSGKKCVPRHENLLVFRNPGPECIQYSPGKKYIHPAST